MPASETPYYPAVTRRTFAKRGTDVLLLTVRRPVFPSLPGITRFYERVSEHFEKQCAAKTTAAARLYAHTQLPCGISVSFRVTLYTERYLSVLLDISVFNGRSTAVTRRAQIWALPSESLLTPADLFRSDPRCRGRLLHAVTAAVGDALTNGAVTQPTAPIPSPAASFRLCNCCLVPRGIAFFFNGNTFSDGHGGIPLFVIPTDSVQNCLRLTF